MPSVQSFHCKIHIRMYVCVYVLACVCVCVCACVHVCDLILDTWESVYSEACLRPWGIFLFDFSPTPLKNIKLVGERAKRARHSQVCSIENRGYIYILYIMFSTCKICSYNP